MSRSLVTGEHPKRGPDKSKGGRPSKFEVNEELMQNLRKALLMGAPVMTAATLCGISYDSMRQWVLWAHEDPDSKYGELIKLLHKAIAEWEIRDLSVIDAHVMGRPAQYLQEPMKDKNGTVQLDGNGKPVMQLVRDEEGRPIKIADEIKSDWRAAMTRLERRRPKFWAAKLNASEDSVLSYTSSEKEVGPDAALSFEDRLSMAMKKIEEEY